jgi:hypothetical protein
MCPLCVPYADGIKFIKKEHLISLKPVMNGIMAMIGVI